MTDPVFQIDQKITPVYTDGYDITLGKAYVVDKYEPQFVSGIFTWPPYVHFVDDFGNKCIAHARRFKEITND